MTTSLVYYGQYAPTEVKVVSLGIGICDDTLSNLHLTNTQSLIVAERIQAVHDNSYVKTYGLIVDDEGIAINTTRDNRASNSNSYAAYIDGDVRITGRVIYGGSNGKNTSVLSGSNDTFFNLANDGTYENIYYAGNVTIGTMQSATSNTHKINVYESAYGNVDYAQVSLQNLQAAQLRMGVIGTDMNSPAIINTNNTSNLDGVPGGAIEFHAARNQDYFSKLYGECGQYGECSQYCGCTVDSNWVDMTPHLRIHEDGNVGVHTFQNPVFDYNLVRMKTVFGSVTGLPMAQETRVPISGPATLHVEGTTYTCNLLIWDYVSESACNVDDLYVRKLGLTVRADHVEPGPFAVGNYSYPGNVTFDNDLFANRETVKQLLADDAIFNTANFNNDAVFQRDIIANQSIRLRGQMYTEVLNNVDADGTSNYGFQMIQWTPASPSLSNINLMGQGISTPGRLGVGINPCANAPVNDQLSVYKFNENIWELALVDKSSTDYREKAAFIGHPAVDGTVHNGIDGSLVIATKKSVDPDSGGKITNFPQNIYFFPGADMSASTAGKPFLKQSLPPALNVYGVTEGNNRVGINVFDPVYELDVIGSISFSRSLVYNPYPGSGAAVITLGLWQESTFSYGLSQFNGMSYIPSRSNAAHVGINTIPDPNYGVVVGGALRVNNGLYTVDARGLDRKMGNWMDNTDAGTSDNNVAPASKAGGVFTWCDVGVGVKIPSATLEVKNNYADISSNMKGTALQLTQGDANKRSSIIFQGTKGDAWSMQTVFDTGSSYFQIGAGSPSNAFVSNNKKRSLWMKQQLLSGQPQVVIGGGLDIFDDPTNPDKNAYLTVGGNMSVLGDVSISGKFKINTHVLVNENVPSEPLSLGTDDVFIGGGNIMLRPGPSSGIIVGDPATVGDTVASGNPAMLRVYAQDTSSSTGVLASFHSKNNNNALIELVAHGDKYTSSGSSQRLLFGCAPLKYSSTTPFVFMDGDGNPYLTFTNSTSSSGSTIGVGVPLGQLPTAQMQVYTSDSGSNMFRLTKVVYNNDSTDDAPEISLEKKYISDHSLNNNDILTQASTTWTMKGAMASWNDKLSLFYSTAQYPGDPINTSVVNTEVVALTSTGCLGIGNTQPEFSLDIVNSNNIGGIRIRDSGDNPSPSIVFQRGSNLYGSDGMRDYRMMSSSNGFRLDSMDVHSSYIVLDVSSSNNIGFRGPSDINYNNTIYGTINLIPSTTQTSGFYLNGTDIFSIVKEIIVTSQATTNVYLSPIRSLGGGVIVNNPLITRTDNLFHIFAGVTPYDNANMMVFDSTLNQAQIHLRTLSTSSNFNVYRTGMSNESFMWKYAENSNISVNCKCKSDYYLPDGDDGYNNAMILSPSPYSRARGFDLAVYGSVTIASDYPTLYMGNKFVVSATAGYLSIIADKSSPGYVGIGTATPHATTNIYSASNNYGCALRVDQAGTGRILELYGSNTGSVPYVVVDNLGNVGIGDPFPRENASLSILSHSNVGLVVTQSNITSNIASFENITGQQVVITSAGFVGIGTASPLVPLHVVGETFVDGLAHFSMDVDVDGNMYVEGNEVTGLMTTNTSDRRLKKDIQKIENALDKVCQLTGYTFARIEEQYQDKRYAGLIAQEVAEVLPEVVVQYRLPSRSQPQPQPQQHQHKPLEEQDADAGGNKTEKGSDEVYLSLAYGNMMGLIVEAIKDLKDQVRVLSEKVDMHLQS